MRHLPRCNRARLPIAGLCLLAGSAANAQTPVLSPNPLDIGPGGAWGMYVSVSGSSSWTATVTQGQDWLTASGGGTQLYYQVAQNGGGARDGIIQATDNSSHQTAQLNVHQEPTPQTWTNDAQVDVSATSIVNAATTVTAQGTFTDGGGYLVFYLYVGYGDWGANGCEIRYAPFWNILWLTDDSGQNAYAGAVNVGQNTIVSNSQCWFSGTDAQVSVPGDNHATITLTVHFSQGDPTSYVGNILADAGVQDIHFNNYVQANQYPGISLSASGVSQTPPSSTDPAVSYPGAANEAVFTVTYTDPTGNAYASDLLLSIDTGQYANSFPNCQLFLWRPWSGSWSLWWDIWNDQGYLTQGTSNSQCTLNPSTSGWQINQTGQSPTITVTFDITFSDSFASSPELWASSSLVDWSNATASWNGYQNVALPAEIDFIRMGDRIIATETTGGGGGGGDQQQSIPAAAQVRGRAHAVRVLLPRSGATAPK